MTCPVKPHLHMRCEIHTRKGRGGFKVWVTRDKYRTLYRSKMRKVPNRFPSNGWRRFEAQIRLADALKKALS